MSATAFELASRLARKHAQKGVSELSVSEVSAVAEALNGGLTDLFRALPLVYRTKDLVMSGSPRVVSVQLVADSATLVASVFTANEIGRTVVISGGADGAWHQVGAVNALVLPWAGATGTYSATVYPDALGTLGEQIERVVGDLVLVEGNGCLHRLYQHPENMALGVEDGAQLQLGRPECYFLQALGFASGASMAARVRLYPVPAVAVRVVVKAQYWPARLRATDLTGSVVVPVPPSCVEDLLDLAGFRVALLPGWGAVDYPTCQGLAQMAMGRIRSLASSLSTPSHRVGIPAGW
jgi:hypothetical protein